MPSIKPFKALRPTAENAQDFSASAYNSDDNFKKAKRYNQSELFYLNIRRPQAFHKKITEEDSFAFSKDIVAKAQESGVLVNDDKDCFYIYSQRKGSRTFTGIIALASIDDLVNNKIKKHEHTRVDKEDLMAKYFQNVGINGNPILLTHEPTNDIDDLLKAAVIAKPIVDFTTPADTQHCLWKIEDENLIASITEAYKKLDSFYISDGHHRCAAYKKLSPQPDGLMAFIIPANQLKVFSFHRIIYNLGGVKRNELIEKISAIFKVEKLEEISQPKKEGEIHLFIKNEAYKISIPKELKASNDFDVAILEEKVIKNILNIEDSRTSKQIGFINATENFDALLKKVESGNIKAIFALYPVNIKDVFRISDAGGIMPPKSTWMEPKLRGGLVIHKF